MDLAAEKVRLLERDAEWAALASDREDVDSIVSYWTDERSHVSTGPPGCDGQACLREYVQASSQIPGFSIIWRSTEVALSQDGNLAYMFGENAVTMDGPTGRRPRFRAGASPSGVENQMVDGAAPSTSGTRDPREGCTHREDVPSAVFRSAPDPLRYAAPGTAQGEVRLRPRARGLLPRLLEVRP